MALLIIGLLVGLALGAFGMLIALAWVFPPEEREEEYRPFDSEGGE